MLSEPDTRAIQVEHCLKIRDAQFHILYNSITLLVIEKSKIYIMLVDDHISLTKDSVQP